MNATSLISEAVGTVIVAVVFLAVPTFVAWLAWCLVFRARRVGVLSGIVLFVLASSSACGLYGHAGPRFALWAVANGYGSVESAEWMTITGLIVTGVFVFFSRKYGAS